MKHNPLIVEVGTIRGEQEAESNGWSTTIFAHFVKENGFRDLITIDISKEACVFSKKITAKFGLAKYINWQNIDALDWIENQPNKSIDAIYIDGWDWHEGEEETSENETLKFTKSLIYKIKDDGIILFDDIFDESFRGKGQKAIPYLISQKWIILSHVNNQVMMVKHW
jgi:predicted O-methyltransferase YrrM